MAASTTKRIDRLIESGEWRQARAAIESELERKPDSHWLLTQLGVTYYEERRYKRALEPLLASLEIVPDCPLTLWNVAGTLDALGKSETAAQIYSWLIACQTTSSDDSCWESDAWADALRTDCVFRLGVSHRHLGRNKSAEHFFRQYIELILAGHTGTYSVDEAAEQIRQLHPNGRSRRQSRGPDRIADTLRGAGNGRVKLPKLSRAALLAAS